MIAQYIRATIAAAVTALAVLIGGQSVYAQAVSTVLTQKAPEAAEIATIADRQGYVRVIVQFAPPAGLNQINPNPTTLAPVKQHIATTQNAIIGTHFGSAANPAAGQGFARSVRRFDITPAFAVNVNRAELEALAADPRVLRIQYDRAVPHSLIQSVPLIGMGVAYSLGATGQGQAVAILDTGVQSNHEFLVGKVVSEACFSNAGGGGGNVSLCPNGLSSQTGAGAANSETAQCINSSTELCVHGTHVAGIAAGKNTSQGGGEPPNGVAKEAQIVAVQIFTRFNAAGSCGGAPPCILSYTSDQIDALNWVLQNAINLPGGVKTASINMSLGGGLFTSPCDGDATKVPIDSLKAAGVATAIAAGNNGSVNAVSSPGCISTAITVGSSDKSDQISSFSNMAPMVDLMAPGSSILSSVAVVPHSTTTYQIFNGTSMATPHVAGAFAAIRTVCPTKTIDEIEAALKSTGTPIVDNRMGGTQTKPRIRVDLAVQQLACNPPAYACTISYNPSTLVLGQSLTVTWNATGGPNGRTYKIYNSSNTVIYTSPGIAVSGSAFVPAFNDLPPGTYTREDTVTGPSGSATCSATLTILAASFSCTISYNPSTIVTGQSLTVTWGASGNPTGRSYRIYNSSNTLLYTSPGIAVSGSVFVPAFSDLPPGTYRREDVVTGPGGGGVCSATLTVLAAAFSCTITYNPSTVVSGQSLTVTWTASGNPTGRNYRIYNSSNTLLYTSPGIAVSGSLFIPAFTDLPPGGYRREDVVTGPGGGGVCSATLTVV